MVKMKQTFKLLKPTLKTEFFTFIFHDEVKKENTLSLFMKTNFIRRVMCKLTNFNLGDATAPTFRVLFSERKFIIFLASRFETRI